MNSLLFTNFALSLPLQALIGIGAGLLLGFLHFLSLKWNTRFYLEGRHGKALALQFGRFAVLIVTLTLVAKAGAVALLCAMAAILGARALVLRKERGAE